MTLANWMKGHQRDGPTGFLFATWLSNTTYTSDLTLSLYTEKSQMKKAYIIDQFVFGLYHAKKVLTPAIKSLWIIACLYRSLKLFEQRRRMKGHYIAIII